MVDMVDMVAIYILICHPEHVHTIHLHKIYYIIYIYIGIRYTLAKRISLLDCCFRRDVGINAFLFRCERLNI